MKADKKRWVLWVCFFLISPTVLATGRYDVSYFWTKELSAAKAYARQVRQVLGPDAAEKVEVVYNMRNRYGVIYDRDGSRDVVSQLAKHHARLLHQSGVAKKGGVDAACLIADRGYVPIGQYVPKKQAKPSQRTRTSTQKTGLDSRLEVEIESYIKELRRRHVLTGTDQTSFVVYDISKEKKVVSINEDQSMMAASLIKNFVMLAYFHQVQFNRLAHTNQNRKHLRLMIQKSYNSSTNYFIKLLGGPRNVGRILRWNYPFFEHTRIVEYIPAGGRTYLNQTSTHDMNRFYNQLWLGKLPYSSKMKYYFGLPKADRLHDSTCIPKDVRVYNKTGTVYGMVGDSGIMVLTDAKGKQHAYIVTGIIEDQTKTNSRNRSQPFASWVKRRSDILRRVSEKSFEYIYEVHYGGKFECRHGSHVGNMKVSDES